MKISFIVCGVLLCVLSAQANAGKLEKDKDGNPYCRMKDGTTIILPPFVVTNGDCHKAIAKPKQAPSTSTKK